MITFIILTKNNAAFLQKCLYHLSQQTWKCWNAIVIDTSTDAGHLEDNAEYCAYTGPHVEHWPYIFENGFAAKNNMGIQEALKGAHCKFVCLLNDDAYVGPAFIEDIINHAAKRMDVYAFSPLYIYANEPDKIQVAGGGYFTPEEPAGEKQRLRNTKLNGKHDIEDLTMPVELDCGYGAAIVYKREVFEKVGFLDEVFKHGFDEPDFAKRMKLRNLKIIYVPTLVHHVCGGSSGGKSFLANLPTTLFMNRARLYFLLKHYPIDFALAAEVKKLKSLITRPRGLTIEIYSILWNIWMAQESRGGYHDLYDPPEPSKFEKEDLKKKGTPWKRPKIPFKLKMMDLFTTYSFAIGLITFCGIIFVAGMILKW